MATMEMPTTATGAGGVRADVHAFEVDFEQSGHLQVDDALERLTELPDLPLAAHADVYDDIHQRLRAVLAEQPADGGAGNGPGGSGAQAPR
jgi:hypothetical protein